MPFSTSEERTASHLRLLDIEQETLSDIAVVQQRVSTPSRSEEAIPSGSQSLLLQKAAATQARRMLACQSAYINTLLSYLNLPCILLSREGRVTLWNAGMIVWTEVGERVAQGKLLQEVLPPSLCEPILDAHDEMCRFAESLDQPREGIVHVGYIPAQDGIEEVAFTLIPRLHTAGVVESTTILLEIGTL